MMSTPLVAWLRLIRYVTTDGSVHYGEPITDSPTTPINPLVDEGKLRATRYHGADAISATPTDQIDEVRELLGPLTSSEVPIVRCIGLNYKAHILEGGRSLPTCPIIFTKPSPSVADYGEDIPIPKLAQQKADYEGELCILIGKDAKNVQKQDALNFVAGYTVGNDVSARDWQREPDKAGPVPQFTFSKSFDKYAPLGPCLVSTKVLGAADKQRLRTFVNGEQRQDGHTSDLCFDVTTLIAFCSQGQTLQKGSLIMTGTPGGVGLFMKPPRFLKDGDLVEVDIEGIGTLKNRFVFE